MIKKSYGCRKSTIPPKELNKISVVRDLTRGPNRYPPVFNLLDVARIPKEQEPYNQGDLGSCTSNVIAFLYVYNEIIKNNRSQFMPSRLFIYYNGRGFYGLTDVDSGLDIYTAFKAITRYGCTLEKFFPYRQSRFKFRPDRRNYILGRYCKCTSYSRINQDINSLKYALLTKHPIAFGFAVYESFEGDEIAETGIMEMPKENEKLMGYHCVCIVGWNDERQAFLCRNSWGPKWGCNSESTTCPSKGYFYMPYEFIVDEEKCFDFFILKRVTDPYLFRKTSYYLTPSY